MDAKTQRIFWDIVADRKFTMSLKICKDCFIDFVESFGVLTKIGRRLRDLIFAILEIIMFPILKVIAKQKIKHLNS